MALEGPHLSKTLCHKLLLFLEGLNLFSYDSSELFMWGRTEEHFGKANCHGSELWGLEKRPEQGTINDYYFNQHGLRD